MQVFSVGKDLMCDSDINSLSHLYKWLVYSYNDNTYDGDGQAVGLYIKDNKLRIINLNHCSCDGPLGSLVFESVPVIISIEEWFKEKESIFDITVSDNITEKVNELLKEHNVKST